VWRQGFPYIFGIVTGEVSAVVEGVLDLAPGDWDNLIETNLSACFLLSKLAAQSMVKQRLGKIINIASGYSLFGSGRIPSYCASKGALVQLTKSMAIELAPFNIQVNAIAPGWIETDMTAHVETMPEAPIVSPELWARYVDAVSERRVSELNKWRGYLRATCNLLKNHKQIAIYKGCWAFPNTDCDGDIRSIYYRVPPKAGEKAIWRHSPAGAKTHALVWGDLRSAAQVAIFESQWDAGTLIDKFSLNPFASDEWALVSTRGAANAKTLEELEIAPSADIYLFPQSDEAGKRWLESILVILGRAAFVVGTDKPHKDLGEWGLNGLTATALQQSLKAAVLCKPKANPKTQPKPKAEPEKIAEQLKAHAFQIAATLPAFYDIGPRRPGIPFAEN
jgi:hypothetical protein